MVPGCEWLSVMFASLWGDKAWSQQVRDVGQSLNTPYVDNKLRLMLFLQLWACRWSDRTEVLMRNRIRTHMWVRHYHVRRVYGFVCLFVSTSDFISCVSFCVTTGRYVQFLQSKKLYISNWLRGRQTRNKMFYISKPFLTYYQLNTAENGDVLLSDYTWV